MDNNMNPTEPALEPTEPMQDQQRSQDSQEEQKHEKTFTRDEVNKMIAAEKAKAEAAAVEKQAEAEKLSKMQADEKAEYELKKAQEKADNAQAELNAYKLKDEAVKIANEKQLPLSFLENINFMSETAEGVAGKIDAMAADFAAEKQKAIEAALKQSPPKTVVNNEGKAPKDMNYDELCDHLDKNPEAKLT